MTYSLADAEQLVIDYLIGVAGVTDIIDPDNIGPRLPKDPVWPCLVISRVGGIPSLGGYLDNPHLELIAWGATKGQARAAAGAAQTALVAITGFHDLGLVTGVFETGDGFRWDPDEATGQPRYRFEVALYIRPTVTP